MRQPNSHSYQFAFSMPSPSTCKDVQEASEALRKKNVLIFKALFSMLEGERNRLGPYFFLVLFNRDKTSQLQLGKEKTEKKENEKELIETVWQRKWLSLKCFWESINSLLNRAPGQWLNALWKFLWFSFTDLLHLVFFLVSHTSIYPLCSEPLNSKEYWELFLRHSLNMRIVLFNSTEVWIFGQAKGTGNDYIL